MPTKKNSVDEVEIKLVLSEKALLLLIRGFVEQEVEATGGWSVIKGRLMEEYEKRAAKPKKKPFDWRDLLQNEFNTLNHPEFVKALEEYVEMRREKRWGKWRPRTWRMNFELWERHGRTAVRQALLESVKNEWRGVFVKAPSDEVPSFVEQMGDEA